jgi:hypothetical protein
MKAVAGRVVKAATRRVDQEVATDSELARNAGPTRRERHPPLPQDPGNGRAVSEDEEITCGVTSHREKRRAPTGWRYCSKRRPFEFRELPRSSDVLIASGLIVLRSCKRRLWQQSTCGFGTAC